VTVAAVADAGPLIHLAEIDSLELLSVLDQLYVPETVYEELAAGGVPSGMTDLSYDCVTPEKSLPQESELDDGERAALSVADEYGAVLLTDDMAARNAAKDANVAVHGSLGLIALAFSRGRIDKNEATTQMRALQREASLFVTDAVVERGIDMLDENE
jgi:predicted nucleic acid-binding protein